VFVRVWRYRVPEGHAAEFEAVYCSTGAWAELFSHGVGYLGTSLSRDVEDDAVWLTIDRWASRAAWEAFLNEHSAAYEALDDGLADLTTEDGEVISGDDHLHH
jgi:heme-degrading monooxygenase HmoA